MRIAILVLVLVCLLCLGVGMLKAQGTTSGLVYVDYYYNINGGVSNYPGTSNQGFQIRRGYFTYNHRISKKFSSRFRLEYDESATTIDNKIGVFVKDAYLRWKEIFPGQELYVGIHRPPSFVVSEDIWGYRSLEKTLMDFRGIATSRDLGVSLKGKLDEGGVFNYWVMVANNSGNRSNIFSFGGSAANVDDQKKHRYYGHLHFKPKGLFQPNDILHVTIYGDFAPRTFERDNFTFAGFVGYDCPGIFSVGVEGFRQTRRKQGLGGADQARYGISGFGWIAVGQQVNLIGRVDFWDPDTKVRDDENLLLIGGIDWSVEEDVHIIPNVELQTYTAPGVDADVVARITFFYILR